MLPKPSLHLMTPSLQSGLGSTRQVLRLNVSSSPPTRAGYPSTLLLRKPRTFFILSYTTMNTPPMASGQSDVMSTMYRRKFKRYVHETVVLALRLTLNKHIDYVTPGVKTTQLKKRSLSKSKRGSKPPGGWGPPTGPWKKPHPPPFPGHHPETNLTGCDTVVTPACIAALYQIPEPNHSANPGNAIGIFEQGGM